MTCVEIKKPGGPEALVPATRPVPQPKDGEILIKVAATGVNRPDIAQRAGLYPPPPGARTCRASRPRATVAASARASRMESGRCAVRPHARRLLRRILHRTGAAMPATAEGLRHAARRRAAGELLHRLAQSLRARSAQGGRERADPWRRERHRTTAIQLAKAFGATVFTTVRNTEKARRCANSAPTTPSSTRTNDWAAEGEEALGRRRRRARTWWRRLLPKNLQLLKQDGRCVVIAVQLGATATISAGLLR